jgi:hypothetical protein
MNVAGQPVKSGNDKRFFVVAASGQCSGSRRPVRVSLSALDLLELGDDEEIEPMGCERIHRRHPDGARSC